jgi:hypothetical protein
MIGVNLLLNGNADSGGAQVQTYGESPVRGWNGDTSFAALKYADRKNPPSPLARAGKYLLTCPTGYAQCKAFQAVDISSAGTLADEGRVSYQLSGWLGGDDTRDNAGLNVTFCDASTPRNPLRKRGPGPGDPRDKVPAGTRFIQATYLHPAPGRPGVPRGLCGSSFAHAEYSASGDVDQCGYGRARARGAGRIRPRAFTTKYGTGPAWAINSNYTFNSGNNAAVRGTWIAFWVTGQGLVDPAGVDGESIKTPMNVKLAIMVSIGGKVDEFPLVRIDLHRRDPGERADSVRRAAGRD